MKLAAFHIFFIIFSVLLLSLTYFFLYSNFFSHSEEILKERKIDILENYKNIFLAFSKLSLYYSTTANLRSETHTWIFNGFNPIDFSELKRCKESATNYFLSLYISKFFTNLPISIKYDFRNTCKWEISENDVLSGAHDEGHFFSNCSDLKIIISSEGASLSDTKNLSVFVSNNRYWYLYRKIYNWAKEKSNEFVACICAATAYGCEYANDCYEKLFSSLVENFKEDKYVVCKKQSKAMLCCHHETGNTCQNYEGCIGWSKGRCILPKEYICSFGGVQSQINYNAEEKIEVESSISSLQSYSNYIVYTTCAWREGKIETNTFFTCEDYKYYESTPTGTDKITFNIGIFAGFRNAFAFYSNVKCFYNKQKAECDSCANNFCEKCSLPLEYCESSSCLDAPEKISCRNCRVEKIGDKYKIISCEKCDEKDPRC